MHNVDTTDEKVSKLKHAEAQVHQQYSVHVKNILCRIKIKIVEMM